MGMVSVLHFLCLVTANEMKNCPVDIKHGFFKEFTVESPKFSACIPAT